MAFKACLVDLAHIYCGWTIDKSDFYLYREHLNAVKSWRNVNNIIISKLDKRAGVEILDKEYYNNKTTDILKDTIKFKILGSVDEFNKTAIEEQRMQREYYKNHQIRKKIYEKICPVGSQRQRLYGLPKIHKLNTPLRPILSMVSSVQHSLAKWLADILEPVLQLHSQHCISDSFTFINQIHNTYIYPNNTFFCFFDIVSL